MIRKFYFNMIEIILAISIIAIAISGVLVLFTTGLRKGNEAVQMNSVPDAVESILTHVRQKAMEQAATNGWGSLTTVFPALNTSGWSGESGVDMSAFNGLNLDTNANNIVAVNGGNLLYRQLVVAGFNAAGDPNRYSSTFSLIAEVRRITPAPIVVSHPHTPLENSLPAAGFTDADAQNAQASCQCVLEVRISYPADVVMAARESKIYRLEIFNDKYNRFLP